MAIAVPVGQVAKTAVTITKRASQNASCALRSTREGDKAREVSSRGFVSVVRARTHGGAAPVAGRDP